MDQMNRTPHSVPAPVKRYRTQEIVHVEVYGQLDKTVCRLENLSVMGALLRVVNTKYMPQAGDIIRIIVDLRSLKKTHIMHSEIIWINGLDVGVKFMSYETAREKFSNKSMSTSRMS